MRKFIKITIFTIGSIGLLFGSYVFGVSHTLAYIAEQPSIQMVGCTSYTRTAEVLYDQYGETMQSRAFDSRQGVVFETWANIERDTWTVIAVNQHGTSCIVGSGENYTAQGVTPSGAPA